MTEPVDVPPSDELARLCLELSVGGARLVGERRGTALAVEAKSTATDLVTDVDTACERWLTAELRRLRPADAVLGEEAGGRPGHSGVRWLLDPIDGTVNFVLGLPLYAVSVAAEVAGTVVAGAVTNPVTGETFHARRGGGAHLTNGTGEQRLTGPRDVPLSRAVVGTGFAYDAGVRARQLAVAAQLGARVADLRRLGAASLDLCFLAAGRLDAYYEAGLNDWDFAAGGLVAAESGCITSGLRGRPAGSSLYAAAGPALATEFFTTLESLDADGVAPRG